MFKKAPLTLVVAGAIASLSTQAEQTTQAESVKKQDSVALSKVTVTGGKLDRDLQTTTTGISVVDSEALEANNSYNLSEALVLTPNASINGRGGFTIRGINAEGGPTSDTATADAAGVIMDGAYFDADLLEIGLALWDVEKVQVYKGPQSTSQGKNALAGTIIVDSNDPVFDTEGSVRLGIGSHNTQITSLMYNQALTDTLAVRFAGERVYTDGQIENKFNGDKDDARNNHVNGRLKLLFQPSEDFKALLTLGIDKVEAGDDRACGSNNSKAGVHSCKAGEAVSFRDKRTEKDMRLDYQTLELEKGLTDNWTVTSITSRSEKKREEERDADNLAPTNSDYADAGELGFRSDNETDKSLSQEFRFNYESSSIRSSVGYFYSDTEEARSYDFLLANPLDAYLPSFYAQTSGAPFGPYANGVSDTVIQTQYTDKGSTRQAINHALFAEFDWKFTDATTLLLGLRFENETNKNSAGVTAQNINQDDITAMGARANPLFAGLQAQAAMPLPPGATAEQQAQLQQVQGIWNQLQAYMVAGGIDPNDTATWAADPQTLNKILNALATGATNTTEKENVNQVFLPKIGIRHQFTEDLGAGFVVTQGYRSGGISLNPINPTKSTVEYNPEYVTNYELSLRSQWLNKKLTANANVYYMDWKDQQVQVIGSNIYDRYIENAGSSSLRGVELDLNYQADNGISAFANAGYAKTRYEDFKTGSKDFSGNRFQYAPEKTAAMGIGFDQGLGVNGYIIANHTGDSYMNSDNTLKVEAYTVANFRLGYTADVWKVNAYVNNVFDKKGSVYTTTPQAYETLPGYVLYGNFNRIIPERSFGLVAQYDF